MPQYNSCCLLNTKRWYFCATIMAPYLLRSFICAIGLLSFSSASAQEKPESGFGIETNILAGKVVKHTVKFTAPIPALSMAFDANFVWKTNGTRSWHKWRKYPQIGIGMTFTDYGNADVLGYCMAVYPNIQIPIIQGEKLEFTARIGDGVGYVTKKFQRTSPVDTLNNAIGSHINDFAIFLLDLRYHFNKHWHIQAGLNLTHISNAGTAQPNLGVNMVGGHFGTTYYPGSYRPVCLPGEDCKLKRRWLLQGRMDIAYKQARSANAPFLPSYMPSAYISKRYNGKNKVYLGGDYAFHNDVLAFMRYYDVDNWPGDHGRQRRESWDGTIFAGHEFIVGRLGIVTQLGFYYHQTYLKYDIYNEKIGGHLYLIQREKGPIKELFVSALLLAHGFAAERAEFGLGFGLL